MGADTFSDIAVIDLGLERGEPESYHRPGRRTTPSWFGPALVAVLLLLTTAASVPPAPAPIAEVLRVPIGPGDPYAITGGRLLVQSAGLLSSYRLADGERHWQVVQNEPVYRLRTAGGLLLLQPSTVRGVDPGTTAVALTSGDRQWHTPHNVVAFPGASLLFAVDGVRSSSSGRRRVQNTVEVLDPAIGLARWRVRVPNTAVLTSVPGTGGGPSWIMLVRDDQVADLYDVTSGAHLASRKLPMTDYDPDNPVAVGGVVLLRHPGSYGIQVSAYDAGTLQPLWTRLARGTERVRACGELACLTGRNGVRAIETGTGAERWRQPAWRSIERFGSRTVAYGPTATGTDQPVAEVDPATGQVLTDLTGWKPVPGTAEDGELLVTREIDPGPRTMVAVVAAGLDRPRLFTELPEGTGDCQATADRLVCRSMYDELIVWEHRASTVAG
ncbi:PQQ-binding-like beta-propeller repeat protein [Actinoplanes sp. GCM10030250]|uniref:outer membrane protein assembly factor BamB family protein n=1 Tax=Actinoplanes sp. GCM10030250 TaxID=3273376 RepID=UPI00361743A9